MYTTYGLENINRGSQGNSECSLKMGMYYFYKQKRATQGVVQSWAVKVRRQRELLAEDMRLKELCLFGQKVSEHRPGRWTRREWGTGRSDWQHR